MATWTPTPAEVKNLLPTRLDGAPFGADTVPTSAQVASLADQLTAEIIGEVSDLGGGPAITGVDIEASAKWAATLGTAAYVESSFFPEQGEAGQQSFAQVLYQRYEDAVSRLRRQVGAANLSGTGAAASTVRVPAAVTQDLYDGAVIYYPGVYGSEQLA